MTSPDEQHRHLMLLRQRAEQALAGKQVDIEDLSSEDIQYLLHELQVHQAELAIQNAELRQTQYELEKSRDEYADLYNFAPVGYCTVNRRDRILDANQAMASLLGVNRKLLTKQTLSHFVTRSDQDRYYLYRRRAFESSFSQVLEIRLVKASGQPVTVRLESKSAQDDNDRLMMMLIDISEQRALQHRLIEQRERERQKIARDLHDGPVQVLSALVFSLRGILIDHPDASLFESLTSLQDSLREQIQVLRDFSVGLRPPILGQLGLEMALRSHLESFAEKHPNIQLRQVIHPVNQALVEDSSLALFRVCQEALQNIAKHAKGSASEVIIRLLKDDFNVRLEIQDNGPGFELPADWFDFVQQGHLGLVGMRERTEAVGGYLDVQSGPGKGTLIKAYVPVDVIAGK